MHILCIWYSPEKFKEAAKNTNKIARTSDVLKSVLEEASSEAKKVFEEESELVHEESLYRPFSGLLQVRIIPCACRVLHISGLCKTTAVSSK